MAARRSFAPSASRNNQKGSGSGYIGSHPSRGIKLGDPARYALLHGVGQIADLLKSLLGPYKRTVVMDRASDEPRPEILTDGATITRRITEIRDPYANMGAMMMRHQTWHVRTRLGDGVALAATLTQAILREATRYVAAGANPILLRHGIEAATAAVGDALLDMAEPIDTEEELAHVATAVTGDAKLGEIIGEIFDILGPDGAIVIDESQTTFLDRAYAEGFQWDSGWLSRYFVTDPYRGIAQVKNPYILITNHHLRETEPIAALMSQVKAQADAAFCVIADGFEDEVLHLLTTNQQQGALPCLAIRTPGYALQRDPNSTDIAILTGARFIDKRGDGSLNAVTLADLGRAREIRATRRQFTLVEGRGVQADVDLHLAQLRKQIVMLDTQKERREQQQRLAKLTGRMGILKIGAINKAERDHKKELAEAAVIAVRAAWVEGVVPGGGAAYLDCRPAVEALNLEGDKRLGAMAVAQALDAPMRVIAQNAGFDPSSIVAQAAQSPEGYGLNVETGQIGDMQVAGILDAAQLLGQILEIAASTAAMALTTEALVLTGQVADNLAEP